MSGHKPWSEIKMKSKADPRRVAKYKRAMERRLLLARLFPFLFR